MTLVPPLVNPLPRTWCPTVKPVKWCFAFLKALHWSAEDGHVEVAELLLTKKAEALAVAGSSKASVMHLAATRGYKC